MIGVPHPSHGEEVKAFVVRTPGAAITETDLIAWCKQTMAAYKYPRIVEFRDSLPMTATGKILKRELAQRAEPAAALAGSGSNHDAERVGCVPGCAGGTVAATPRWPRPAAPSKACRR